MVTGCPLVKFNKDCRLLAVEGFPELASIERTLCMKNRSKCVGNDKTVKVRKEEEIFNHVFSLFFHFFHIQT